MILADSSAWVAYLRRTGTRSHLRLRQALARGELATTEIVVMELLAGEHDPWQRARLRRLLQNLTLLPVGNLQTYEAAAEVYRSCRAGGETIRRMTDCVVAAVAIQAGVALLHQDRDFDAIARHSRLTIA